MSSSGVSKATADKNQRILLDLVAKPGNDTCADCKSRAPRWASHNLGIFICVRCATVHRKIGTHVTKVKSVTLDSWSKEQVENMKNIGNIKANQRWNPDERRNPPPTNMEESERDSELEKYIRVSHTSPPAKYEHKRFVDRSAEVAARLGPSLSKASLPPRSHTAPLSEPPPTTSRGPLRSPTLRPPADLSLGVPSVGKRPATAAPPSPFQPVVPPQRTTSQPFPPARAPTLPLAAFPGSSFLPQTQSQPAAPPRGDAGVGVWNDLLSLQTPSTNSSLPLQYQTPSFSSAPTPTPSFATAPTQSFSPVSMQSFSPAPTPSFSPASTQAFSPAATASINPYATLSVGTPSALPAHLDRSPNTRSTSLPAFGTGGFAGTPAQGNLFQLQQQQQPQFLSTSPAPNPFVVHQQFTGMPSSGMGMGMQQQMQPQQSQQQHAFQTQSLPQQQPQQQQQTAYMQQQPQQSYSQSPFGGSYGQQQQPQQQQPFGESQGAYSQQVQQAQQLFQNMASGTNPFGQGWGHS